MAPFYAREAPALTAEPLNGIMNKKDLEGRNVKLIHLSDLHLGKRVNDFSMLEDQRFILDRILEVVDACQPQGVLIAGDVYDKGVPPAEAVQLFDDFLWALAQRGAQVFIISGNHDSGERLAFGGRLMKERGIHLSPVYDGRVTPLELRDRYGPVRLYLLPFLKPVHVRRFFPEAEIESYTDALATAIEAMEVDPAVRNVLVAHQFVTGGTRSESEELSVGGADNVDAGVFDVFDYVALGHLHGPQKVGRETLRYCGTPLKYSFSEAKHKKSVTLVELGEKGTVTVDTVPLTPLRDLRELRGTFAELTHPRAWEGTDRTDYLRITLTDEEDLPDALGRLRTLYPNLMRLDYDNRRTRAAGTVETWEELGRRDPLELFERLYEQQNGQPMSPQQREFSARLLEQVREVEP